MTARGDQIGLTTESESALAVKPFYATWELDPLSLSSIIFLLTKIDNHLQYIKIIAQARSFERCKLCHASAAYNVNMSSPAIFSVVYLRRQSPSRCQDISFRQRALSFGYTKAKQASNSSITPHIRLDTHNLNTNGCNIILCTRIW